MRTKEQLVSDGVKAGASMALESLIETLDAGIKRGEGEEKLTVNEFREMVVVYKAKFEDIIK